MLASEAQILATTTLNTISTTALDALSASRLSTTQVAWLTTTAIGNLTTAQADALTTSQVGALAAGQVDSLTSSELQGFSTARHPYRMMVAHHRSALRFTFRTTRGWRRAALPLAVLVLGARMGIATLRIAAGR